MKNNNFNGNYIENPEAYARAKSARIKANANITRRKKLVAAIASDSEEFRVWLLGGTAAELRAMELAHNAWRKRVGYVPDFLFEALTDWGGLTDNQLAFARKKFAENVARAEGFAAKDEARRSGAPAWVAGRQVVEGVVQSIKEVEQDAGYGHTTITYKGMLKLDDGRLLWTTVPGGARKGHRLTMRVAVTPADNDPTMGFGKRPTKVEWVDSTPEV